jgi:FlaG/FlaF family flagellin (archaellin)
MRYQKKKKRGLSPVIANLLLIGLVIVIIAIVFVWFKGMVEEGITKFEKNIRLVCDDINFNVEYSGGKLNIQNNGEPPIYTMNVKMIKTGEFETQDIKSISEQPGSWPSKGLKTGEVYSQDVTFSEGVTSISLAPVLVGTSPKGKQRTFTCEGQYEKEVYLS